MGTAIHTSQTIYPVCAGMSPMPDSAQGGSHATTRREDVGVSNGRCVGCGRTGAIRKIQIHVTTCPQYLERFRTGTATDPAEEFLRQPDDSAAVRAQARDIRLRNRFAELDHQQRQQQRRWMTPKDPLD